MEISNVIKQRILAKNKRYHCNDNISEFIEEGELDLLQTEVEGKLQEVLNTEDVACVIDAKHLCVNSRGIRDIDCSTVTSEFGGKFKKIETRREFLDYIKLNTTF